MVHFGVLQLGSKQSHPQQLPNLLVDGLPLDWVVLIELLNELRVFDLRDFPPVVHHGEVRFVLFAEPTVQIVLVVAGPNPEVAVEVGLQRLHRLQHQYEPQIDLPADALHGVANVLLHEFRS